MWYRRAHYQIYIICNELISGQSVWCTNIHYIIKQLHSYKQKGELLILILEKQKDKKTIAPTFKTRKKVDRLPINDFSETQQRI